MAISFKKLYAWAIGRGKAPPPTPTHHELPGSLAGKRERIRQTVADQAATRAAKKGVLGEDLEAEFAKLKGKIAGAGADVRDNIRKQFEEEERRRQAESPQEQFMNGLRKLTLNIDFRSSNPAKPAVYQVWYAPGEESMYVTFYENGGAGRTYRYWTVTRVEALRMYIASSKGIEIWTTFRVRGSRTLHRKSYEQVG